MIVIGNLAAYAFILGVIPFILGYTVAHFYMIIRVIVALFCWAWLSLLVVFFYSISGLMGAALPLLAIASSVLGLVFGSRRKRPPTLEIPKERQ